MNIRIGLKGTVIFTIVIFLISCQSNNDSKSAVDPAREQKETTQHTTDSLSLSENVPEVFLENYEIAKRNYLNSPNNADSIIWYGRRTAYLGEYQKAIDIYTKGIQIHPKDARLYRHRGHRYISTRQYDKAINDLEFAVTLIEGQNDQIEPDGLPNERNIPLTTLHGNIWYHLGLAYYLKNDLDNALSAFSHRTVTEKYPDNIVSGGHWQYMILRRMGKKKEADAAISKVSTDMDIIENYSYYRMCQFYKQMITEEELKPKGDNSAANDVFSYGLGNWYLYDKKDTLQAKKHLEDLLKNGNKYSFAYLAAEADWDRLFKSK